MNRDDIIRTALEAGFSDEDTGVFLIDESEGICTDELIKFAALVSAAERNAIGLSAMFQDAEGTTQVTDVNQPVGLILDKRKCARMNELIKEVIAELEAMERLVRRQFPEFVHPLISKLRAAPPAAQRQPLTDAEIDALWCEYPSCEFGFARAIEAAHGIK